MGSIFLAIELVFKGIGLWDQFSTYITKRKIAELEVSLENLDQAVAKAKIAESEKDALDAQSSITRHRP